ncbi:hypothetical protein SLEP1_g52373 [Rubroshorea leprosula]|uniref:Uncharacterized protein n=1 Tax=Rubroshorea leprosula TaxID=152421 RepID=A0AAV5M624_9ROSI|nr:hypothetical protein SLEP1_g52373 [Rubroshorea leprosula]
MVSIGFDCCDCRPSIGLETHNQCSSNKQKAIRKALSSREIKNDSGLMTKWRELEEKGLKCKELKR